LEGIDGQSYGAATRGVKALIDYRDDGYSVKDLIRLLTRYGFDLGDNPEGRVRSAIKNLREAGEIIFNSTTGRYQRTAPKEAAA
jgi:hypothetical protein